MGGEDERELELKRGFRSLFEDVDLEDKGVREGGEAYDDEFGSKVSIWKSYRETLAESTPMLANVEEHQTLGAEKSHQTLADVEEHQTIANMDSHQTLGLENSHQTLIVENSHQTEPKSTTYELKECEPKSTPYELKECEPKSTLYELRECEPKSTLYELTPSEQPGKINKFWAANENSSNVPPQDGLIPIEPKVLQKMILNEGVLRKSKCEGASHPSVESDLELLMGHSSKRVCSGDFLAAGRTNDITKEEFSMTQEIIQNLETKIKALNAQAANLKEALASKDRRIRDVEQQLEWSKENVADLDQECIEIYVKQAQEILEKWKRREEPQDQSLEIESLRLENMNLKMVVEELTMRIKGKK